ncbi:MAG: HAMP domain-containing protein [Hydrogenophilales bacterium]|nr:HAMP domain-containing protein [Hydrogenophilales bacterium]
MRHALSLGQQNALRLAAVFVVFEGLIALAVVFLVMLPMAQRAASDLAGLMVLSAQTWSELPPETRPAFERELASGHRLMLTERAPARISRDIWRGPYIHKLEAELVRRAGPVAITVGIDASGDIWHWARLPSGGGTLWVGFSHARFGPQPFTAGLLTLVAGLLLAVLAAWWLSRLTVAPLMRFERAVTALGRGETPAFLDESGPRELAALARRFNALANQVQNLLEARTTLLAGLSHDLRTPLARMRLALEMLERRPDPAWIARLDSDIGEMNRLIGDLLEFAQGLGQEPTQSIELASWLEALAARARESDTDIEVHCPALHIDAAPAALKRVLGNLLGNAQRYASGRTVEIRVEADQDTCRIGILDRGPGIPESQLETVFRPFHRVDASRSPATGGTGLGLAIVQQLAQANAWHVWLENRPEGGLAAWLSLPLASTRPI